MFSGHGCNNGSIVRWRETVKIEIVHVFIIKVNIGDARVLLDELVMAIIPYRVRPIRVFLERYIIRTFNISALHCSISCTLYYICLTKTEIKLAGCP